MITRSLPRVERLVEDADEVIKPEPLFVSLARLAMDTVAGVFRVLTALIPDVPVREVSGYPQDCCAYDRMTAEQHDATGEFQAVYMESE